MSRAVLFLGLAAALAVAGTLAITSSAQALPTCVVGYTPECMVQVDCSTECVCVLECCTTYCCYPKDCADP